MSIVFVIRFSNASNDIQAQMKHATWCAIASGIECNWCVFLSILEEGGNTIL